MTREEAIGILNETQVIYFAPNGKKKVQEALDMAIENLSEPSKVDYRTDESANIGTEVNDLISREDAVKVVEQMLGDVSEEVVIKINCLTGYVPTADRPHGVWHDSFGFAHCSLCGFGVPRPIGKQTNFNYCPKCGARLEVAE